MKRYLYILLSVALALSCAREELAPETGGPGEGDTGRLTVPVVMHFAEPVTLHAETRATAGMEWGIDPRITSIHVAVFGWGGYLQDYITAVPCDANGNPVDAYATENAETTDGPTNYFLVNLPVNTDGRRSCHIIANGPDSVEFGYDTDLMKQLVTTDGNGGYWQWVYLEHGILPARKSDGEFDLDADGNLKPSEEVMEAFENISLIRNFASVSVDVDENCKNFQIMAWTICQMPLEGSFAPFSSEWEAGQGVIDGRGYGWLGDYATDWTYIDATATVSNTAGGVNYIYGGFPTNPRIDTYIPQTPSAFHAAGVAVDWDQSSVKYIYERAVTSDSNPFLLLEARYVPENSGPNHDYTSDLQNATPCYYRIDIAKNGEYVPFYRNYMYKITITGVSIDGYNTPAMAARHNSSDNFSLSLDTATLSDVSDGMTRLNVENSSFTFAYDADDAEESFWYDFIRLDTNPEQHLNTNPNVTVSVTGNAIKSDPPVSLGVDPGDASRGRITYTLEEPEGDEILTSTIKIIGEAIEGGQVQSRLVRNVTVVVFNKMHVTPKFVPQVVSKQEGEETTLTIPLYKDLPWTLFPLQLRIEDTNKTLNPSSGSNIPVEVGPLKEGEKSTFYYVYTLNYSDYLALNEDAKASGKTEVEIPIPMTTILKENATTARVWNDYFALQEYPAGQGSTVEDVPRANLLNDDDDIITPNTATVAASATSYTFTVKSTGNWILTVNREHGAAATGITITRPSGGPGSYTDVTVNFPVNPSLVERKYIVTLTNLTTNDESNRTRTAEITQRAAEPFLTLGNPTVTSIKGNDLVTESTISVTSNSEWEAAITTGADYAEFVTDNIGIQNGSVTVKMKANNYGTNGATGRSVTVTFTNLNSGQQYSKTITQRGLYTSSPYNSSGLSGTNQTLSASGGVSGTNSSISFSSSDPSQRYSVVGGLGAHYYVGSGTFTATGSGNDFCSLKELTLSYRDGLALSFDGACDYVSTPSRVGSITDNNHKSTWSMASPVTAANAVNRVVLTPHNAMLSSGWHVISLSATYYYWQ